MSGELVTCESLGVSRINHILRFHGHTILQEQRAAEVYDEIGKRSLERLFPGLTKDSMTQATLSAGQSGIWVQKSARHRCSFTPGSSHRSHNAHPGHDPRRSLGRPSLGANPGGAPHRGHRDSHLHLSQRS